MSDTTLRARWAALEPQTKGALVSLVVALTLLVTTKAANGDFLGGYTDHLHHAHMTWAFFHVGPEVYTKKWAEAALLAPGYPHPCITWEQYPNPYPPGMHVVFLVPMLIGKYLTLEHQTYAKLVVGYLMLIMTVATWHLGAIMRRVESPVWTVVLAAAWIFCIRASLMGFYDGAWLLAGLLSVRALERKEHARAVLWFVACALINYRAVSFAPFGVLAAWKLLTGDDPRWKKNVVIVLSAVSAVAVVLAFYAMVKGAPENKAGAESMLLPLRVRGWTLLLGGLGLAVVLFRTTSKLTGVSVAVSTLICIAHANHSWHGMVCIPPLVALSFSPRRPLWAQLALGLWMIVFWRFAFLFEPLHWIEELFVFIEQGGVVYK